MACQILFMYWAVLPWDSFSLPFTCVAKRREWTIQLGNQSPKPSGSQEILYIYIIFLSFFCGCTIRLTCRILLPWPRIAPTSLAVKTWSPNHWITWEFPGILYILKSLWITNLPIALLLQKYSSPRFQSLALDSYGSFNHTVSLLHLETLPTAPSQK